VTGLGELFSLGAALVWAFAVLLLRRSGESVAPFALNLYRVGVSSVIFLAVVLVLGEPLFPSRPWQHYALLALSGVVGIAVSDTLLHRSINLVGAVINAIVDCLYSPFVAITALLILDERLGPAQIAGMALVIAAVLVTTQARPPRGATHRMLLVGIGWGVLAMVTLAFGVVIAKPVLAEGSILWVTTMRQLAALAVMAPAALAHPRRRRLWSVFVPDRSWRTTLPATLLGSVFALFLWLGGMKYTQAGIAAVLNQTSTIFILVLAALLLKEPFTLRRTAAALIAVVGIALVTLG
jgi:drug/metabolite transporter (DMT)-like permease